MLTASAPLATVAQNVFNKTDRKAELSIGVGTVAYADKNRPTFDQHLGMEWGVASVAERFTVGLGFKVNNSYGGNFESMVAGTYDYSYTRRSYGKIYRYSTKKWESFDETTQVKRSGVGTGDGDISREDVDAQFTATLHFSPMSRFDTYIKVGVGVGYMHWMISNIRNENGFGKADVNETNETSIRQTTDIYSYDDLAHTKWQGLKSKVVPAMSIYLGATYMLTEKWGLDAQIGLISARLKGNKRGYPNSYSIFAVGASYIF